ncbi:XdhC family protein [Escherichia coli]|nr:XdhC family protein [Escherichia coli]EQX93595.1 xanthine dehydrogenase accessory factor [Escherichia coli UMEA 3201-1]
MSYPLFDKDEHWHKPEQAFLTDDHRIILRFAVEALMSGKGAVLVTLVEIHGGAARPLGAQMVVREDGRYCGFVSGGCVEAAAAFEALEMMGSGRDREIRYGEGSPWFDIVLPCGGGITLTLHKLRSAQPLLAVLNRLEQRKPAGLRYDPQAQSLVCLPTQTRTGWNLNGFEVGFRPCVRLMIYGRSLEAQATASLAAATGYDSHIFDLFPASASAQIDTDTAVILLCHDLNRELPALQAAREAKPFYLGALGSHRTHTLRLQKLHELGWSREETAQIRAPVGIFPKARDAHTLALSVLAEIASVRLHHEEDSCLPPVVLILAAGRGERFLASGGNTHKCIGWRQSPEVAPYRWPFEENGRTFDLAIEPQITTNDLRLMLRLALAGGGITIATQETFRPYIESGKLVSLLDDFLPQFPGFYLYFPQRRNIAPKLRALIDYVKEWRQQLV